MPIDFKKRLSNNEHEHDGGHNRRIIVSAGRVMGVPGADPFTDFDTEIRRRLTLVLQGDEKTGKTHLSLTAPDPIALININRGTEGVIQKFKIKYPKRIFKQIKISLPNKLVPSANEKQAKEEWRKAKEAHIYACTSGRYRTVIWDTEDEMWLLSRMSRWSDLRATPTEYAPVNNEYMAMLNLADEYNVNLILIDKLKDEYKEKTNQNSGKKVSVATGGKKRDGFKHVGYAATEIIEAVCDDEDNFGARIVRSRHRSELNNVIYTPEDLGESKEDLNFINLACQIVEGSTPKQWSL